MWISVAQDTAGVGTSAGLQVYRTNALPILPETIFASLRRVAVPSRLQPGKDPPSASPLFHSLQFSHLQWMCAAWGSRACTESLGSCHFALPSHVCSVLAVFLILQKPSAAPGQLLAGKRAGESAFSTHELVQRLIPIWLVLSWGGFCHFICNCFAVKHLEGFTPRLFNKGHRSYYCCE